MEDIVKLKPMGDYYIWYCDWCDSRNLTLWTRIEAGTVVCGACHTAFPMYGPQYLEKQSALSHIL